MFGILELILCYLFPQFIKNKFITITYSRFSNISHNLPDISFSIQYMDSLIKICQLHLGCRKLQKLVKSITDLWCLGLTVIENVKDTMKGLLEQVN